MRTSGFYATAKLLGRTLRQTPNSEALIKSIPCNPGTQILVNCPSKLQVNEDSLESPLLYSQSPQIIPHQFYIYNCHSFSCQLVSEVS